jgi:hypothetical protein
MHILANEHVACGCIRVFMCGWVAECRLIWDCDFMEGTFAVYREM